MLHEGRGASVIAETPRSSLFTPIYNSNCHKYELSTMFKEEELSTGKYDRSTNF